MDGAWFAGKGPRPEAHARSVLFGTLVAVSLVTSGSASADRKVVHGMECKRLADSSYALSQELSYGIDGAYLSFAAGSDDVLPVYCPIERESVSTSESLDDLDVYMTFDDHPVEWDEDPSLCGVMASTRTFSSIIDSEVRYAPSHAAYQYGIHHYSLDFDRLDNGGSTWTNFVMVCHLAANTTVHSFKYNEE